MGSWVWMLVILGVYWFIVILLVGRGLLLLLG